MFKECICNLCEKKCIVKIKNNDYNSIIGNKCSLGIDYAKIYNDNTKDFFTSLVRLKGSNQKVISVKSSEPMHKSLWLECSRALSRIYVGPPIKIGDIICKNILNTGINIIATRNID